MAQLVGRVPARHEVMGSNPDCSVTFSAENIPVLSGLLVIQMRTVMPTGLLYATIVALSFRFGEKNLYLSNVLLRGFVNACSQFSFDSRKDTVATIICANLSV